MIASKLEKFYISLSDVGLKAHILLNKADKLTKGAAASTLLQVRKAVSQYPHISVQTFSALNQQGLETCWQVLDQWLHDD